jgi:hypothetical protein
MQLQEMPLDKIEAATYNPRVPLEPGMAEFERLAASLSEFDLVEPLVWNKKTNRLVGGHQRLQVMRHLGRTTAWVSVVELDEDREKILNIALNNPNLQSDWDAPALIRQIEQMDADAIRLAGFDSAADAHEILRRHELSQETSFLDLFKDGGEDVDSAAAASAERPREIDLKEEHEHRTGPQFFNVQLVFDAEQRAIFYKAVDRIKRAHSTDNTFEALTAHFQEFNDQWDRDHVDEGKSNLL